MNKISSFLNDSKDKSRLLSIIREFIPLTQFNIGNITIIIYSRPTVKLSSIKRIIMRSCISVNNYMQIKRPVKVHIYLTDILKSVDNSASGIYKSNINSGFYDGSEIYIFRVSELARVLTHELVHHLRIFRTPSLLEAQTEALAEYIFYAGKDKYTHIAKKAIKILAIICKIYKINLDNINTFGDFELINPHIMRDSNILYYVLYKLPIYSELIAHNGDHKRVFRVDPRKVLFPSEYRDMIQREMRVNKEVYAITIL